jgi:hypothetical protein
MRKDEAIRLAQQIVALEAKPYDNDEADARNLEFYQLTMRLVRAVLGIPHAAPLPKV